MCCINTQFKNPCTVKKFFHIDPFKLFNFRKKQTLIGFDSKLKAIVFFIHKIFRIKELCVRVCVCLCERVYVRETERECECMCVCVFLPQSSVPAWLNGLSMTQYENTMLEAGYDDIDFICDITVDDLHDLGITKRGMYIQYMYIICTVLFPDMKVDCQEADF